MLVGGYSPKVATMVIEFPGGKTDRAYQVYILTYFWDRWMIIPPSRMVGYYRLLYSDDQVILMCFSETEPEPETIGQAIAMIT